MNKKKILMCGDRNWSSEEAINQFFKLLPKNIIIISGNARGADYLVEQYCKINNIENKIFPANWKKHGKAAGPIRNNLMLDEKPELVIAFHGDIRNSKGTIHTVSSARTRKIPVLIVEDVNLIVCPKCNNEMECAQIENKDYWSHKDYTVNTYCNYNIRIEME
jgi:hypothetical protein